jgi:hypothetical protein
MPSRSASSFARGLACALVLALAAGQAPRLAAAGNDADAGTWRLIVLTHYRSDIEIGKDRRVGGYTVSFARTDGADLPR